MEKHQGKQHKNDSQVDRHKHVQRPSEKEGETRTHTERIDRMCFAKHLRTETGVKISSVLYWRRLEL